MEAIEALLTRKSAVKLGEPTPPSTVVDTALQAALRAPDHGRLRPWRFILVSGAARERLGTLMADSLVARKPDTAPAEIERERGKPMRAPLIIIVAAVIETDHPKIPEVEQVLSAGAAAQNIMLAFHAMGYGCMWKTGGVAYDSGVKAAFGLAEADHIVGLLYAGTETAEAPDGGRPDAADFVSVWSPA
jgi:nitroreductase